MRRSKRESELRRVSALTVTVEGREPNGWRTVGSIGLGGGMLLLFRARNYADWRLRDPIGGWIWQRTQEGTVKTKVEADEQVGTLFELLHRAKRGERWKRVATAGSRAELLGIMKGNGAFYIREAKAETARTEEPSDAAPSD